MVQSKEMTCQFKNTLALLIVLIYFQLILKEDMSDVWVMSFWLMSEESLLIY